MSFQILPPRQCLPMKAGCGWSATVHGRRSDLSEVAVRQRCRANTGASPGHSGPWQREDRLSASQIGPHFPHPKPIPPPTFLKTARVPPPSWSLGVPQRLNSSSLTSPRCSLFCLHSAVMPDGAALSPDWTIPERMFPDISLTLVSQYPILHTKC